MQREMDVSGDLSIHQQYQEVAPSDVADSLGATNGGGQSSNHGRSIRHIRFFVADLPVYYTPLPPQV